MMIVGGAASPPPIASMASTSTGGYNTGNQSSCSLLHPEQTASIRDFPVNGPQAANDISTSTTTSSSAFLDVDTRISRESYRVASVASGAVIQAVDMVAQGRVRHIFVPVRPPGHHAGCRGAVVSPCFWKAPNMCSSGKWHSALSTLVLLLSDTHPSLHIQVFVY